LHLWAIHNCANPFANRINTNMRLVVVSLLLAVLAFTSCTPHRKMVYLQDLANQGSTIEISAPEYLLRPGDILHIRVLTLDAESRELFNANVSPMGFGGGMPGNANFFVLGYTVDALGNIVLPVVGNVQVGGLSLAQATQIVQTSIDQYLVDATVDVKLVNFTISVLGEVRRPGQFFIFDNKVTILDAISMAGDLTEFGNRNINVVRRSEGKVTFHNVDLTSRKFLNSDVFFLQPGDLVYVEPTPLKQLGFAQFPFGVIFSAVSTALLLINFMQR